MNDNEKKVNAAEEKTEENSEKLTDEQLEKVAGGGRSIELAKLQVEENFVIRIVEEAR